MIESIIIFQDCGLLLYENKWKIDNENENNNDNNKDPEELVSGFLSVMFSYFSNRYGEINAIKTKNNIILIKKIENFFIALVIKRFIHDSKYSNDEIGMNRQYNAKNNDYNLKKTLKQVLIASKDNYAAINSIESEIWLFNQRIEEISHNLLIAIIKKIREKIKSIRETNPRYKISENIFTNLHPLINLIVKNGNQRITTIEEIFKEKINIILSLQTMPSQTST